MTPDQLLNDPRYRKVLAAGGIGAAMLLALIMKKRAASKTTSGGAFVSAVPPANPPVDSNANSVGQALAGLSQATNLLTAQAATLTNGSGTPVAGSGAGSDNPTAAAQLALARQWNIYNEGGGGPAPPGPAMSPQQVGAILSAKR